MSYELDLIVLVADADAAWALRTLLSERTHALGIRPIQFEVQRHPRRDAGVFHEAADFLRLYLRRAHYALVLLDHEGSGQESLSVKEIEETLEQQLSQTGWSDRAAVIALEPELEVWVWSRSSHVSDAMGLTQEQLQQVLANYELNPDGKPHRPKEAMETALRQSGRPRSPRIYQELAKNVSLQTDERAFSKLRDTLQKWFSA